ncbi:MAG: nitroreductase family protein [Novosphingobium sp.]|nr:nitroreductase family protein [Novosphingobium sp.]MCP5400982.1 nitroreductase family protein [Novosphingobium sp.]
MKLGLSVDEVLTTTRAVRKRLDVTRPVPREILEECLEIALQAPNGSNRNTWRWIIVDEPEMVARLADEYKAAMGLLNTGAMPTPNPLDSGVPGEDKILESAMALVEKLDRMPAILIPLMPGRPDGKGLVEQASMWGSIVQAVWSFMLALRERGLGSIWATVTTRREKEIAELLGIPHEEYTQVGFFPIAYTVGTEFKKAWRRPVSEVLSYNRF